MQSCVNFKTAFDYLLMLTIFHVQKVLIIFDWCLCDFLLLKPIDEVDGLHLHLSLTDVDIFFVWKIFYNFNTGFDYLLMLTYFSCAKCFYHSQLMFMWFSVTETYRWSGWTSSSFVIDIYLYGKYFTISIVRLIIYWCWHVFHVQNVLIILNWCLCDFLLLKHINEVDGLHLHLSLTYFCVENILRFQYCFWLFTDVDIFFMCKMFLSFSTDVYVIFCYWNISMKWMDFIFICHWHIFCVESILQFQYCFWLFTDVDIFSCAKCSYYSRLMFMWFSVTETYRWSGWTSSSFVIDIFLCGKYFTISILLLSIYWCWHIFHVQNVLIILNWCLCDFLLLKHIDEVDGLHLHLSLTYFLCGKYFTISILLLIIYWCWHIFMCKMFLLFSTDVYVIFCYWNISMKWMDFIFICHWHIFVWKIFYNFNTAFEYILMLTYFSCAKCSYHSQLMFMWFSVTETYQWSGWTSSSFVIDIFFVWKVFYNFNTAFDYLLMLTYFSCAKCSYHSQLMFMWFSVTETYRWSGWTSSSFCHLLMLTYFHVENVPQFQYCFWLFTDVDIFFLCKMFLSCSHHIPEFQYCFWLFTDVDYFSCAKVSLRKFP